MKITQIKKCQILIIFICLFCCTNGFCQINSTDSQKKSLLNECFKKLNVNNSEIIFHTNKQLDIKMLYSFGSEYFKNKSYTKALPYLWKVFLNDTSKYAKNAINRIADSYYNLEKADSVLYSCRIGLKRFPDNPRLHYYAAYIFENKENYKCHDCSKELKLNGEEIVGGKMLVYEVGSDAKVQVAKCDACFEKSPSLQNYQECEVYSRVVGFYRPVKNWHKGKQQEFGERKEYACGC